MIRAISVIFWTLVDAAAIFGALGLMLLGIALYQTRNAPADELAADFKWLPPNAKPGQILISDPSAPSGWKWAYPREARQ